MTAPMVTEGAMTGEMFLAYVEQCLVPSLRRNGIVVMDNCRVHLVAGIREAIEKARATLRYSPKYSPDLNPIELPYSKFKALLRKVAARTVPELYRTIRSFVPQLSAQECATISGMRAMLQYDREPLLIGAACTYGVAIHICD
jgi:transposase